MNKKFSTLMASLLLATAFGTVQAVDKSPVETKITPCGAGQITGTDFASKEQLNAKQFYFVQDENDKFLSISEATEGAGFQAVLVEKTELTSLDALNHALWKIEPQVTEDGGVTRFVLTNKATGMIFAYDPETATKEGAFDAEAANLGGAYPNWKWFGSKFAGKNFSNAKPLSVIFSKGDSTMVLGTNDKGVVFAHKYATNKKAEIETPLSLKIVKAGTYVLSAADLNKETSKAGVPYMQLNFGEDNENNIFAEKYQAQQLVTSNAKNPFEIERKSKAGYTDKLEKYLVLNKIDEKGNLTYNYLRIDTSYYKSKGETYKTYNQIASSAASFKEVEGKVATANGYNVIDVLGKNLPDDAFRFQFVKNLANDSVWVRSLVEAVELKKATSEGLYNAAAPMNTKWTYAYAVKPVTESTQADDVNNGAGTNLILSHCTLEGETEKVITFYTCDADKPADNYVNLLAYDGVSQNYTTIAAGVYKISVKGTDKMAYNNFCGKFGLSAEALQEYTHMPAFQWVVEPVIKNGEMAAVSPVKVINREFKQGFKNNSETTTVMQFVKAEGLAANEIVYDGVTYVFNAIDPTEEGYYRGISEDEAELETYRLTYLSGLAAAGANLEVGLTADETLKVGAEGVDFTLVPTTDKLKTYGVENKLERMAYKLMANGKYVVNDATENGTVKYMLTDDKNAAAVFYLKENNCVDGTHYYALIEVISDENQICDLQKAGVDDVTAELRPECACCETTATRTSAFALTKSTTPLYRRLGVTNAEDGLADLDVQNAKIFRVNATAKEYLYEDANSVYSAGKGINFLGVEGKGDNKLAAITVDTAYVRNETTMPQYLFVMGYEYHEAGMMCPENDEHNDADYIAKFGDCGHKVPTQAYATGRYLVNFADSVAVDEIKADYIWNNKYTRLGFVEAKHIGDTLVIYRNGQPSTAAADSIFLGDNKHNKKTDAAALHAAHENGIKNAVFALRLTGTGEADFMIETEGDKKIPSQYKGAWVAIKNGVPVVANYASYKDAIADAEIFNIEATTEEATANEAIEAAGVQVIGGQGVVTVQGAAGKVITVANILGQTIANQVAASDNVTIAAPAGVVVVAVEGEATKVVVK